MCLKKLNLSNLHWVHFWLIPLNRKQIQIRRISRKNKANITRLYVQKTEWFFKKNNKFKTATPQTNGNKVLKLNILDNVGDLFNDLYYIYKDKYNKGKYGLNTKDKKLLYYKKLRVTDDYQYESEEEEEEEKQQTSKKHDKKELPKRPIKNDVSKFNEWVNKKERGINSEIFQKHFSFQRLSNMLKDLYKINENIFKGLSKCN